MATFPSDICVLVGGYSESMDAGVIVSEMERGPAKMRVASTRVIVRLQCALLFNSTDDYGDFVDWWQSTIKRVGWFTVQHPRTGETITARFERGAIGQLVPVNNNRRRWKCDVVLEYMR